MDPMSIIEIISWKVPYIIGHFFKFFVFLFYMLRINTSLTVLSVVLMVLFRFGVLRPVDKKFEVLTKMEQKVKTMLTQTQSESLHMITSVKVGSDAGDLRSISSPAVQQGAVASGGAAASPQADAGTDALKELFQACSPST
jgi:ABC-type bacteriocin/lantibiotic exporter with double-glycine peptidase domain